MDFLDKKPTYKALSYKWGSSDSCEILLDGLSHKICKNLHRFLIQARERNDILSGLLWIDALCIDQVNNQEKKHQVDLMWSIYETAKQVVVWLGPAYEGSDRALRMLKKLSQHGWSLKKPSKFWKSPEGIGAQQLCNRKYWTRVWIFQELYFA
ncbi:heterokaryon incompatibility, partial [Polychaeton citri CBS 116435]